ncbi:D-alanyl-D-alanine carboxypeptidase family protein [Methylogaea oryzae]|uniref:serine-type D-Ala-D-Ala carboxypeptidase n=1 Tax=Methylogaea oryzae TaxID=1295382 RepID=A0A8D4VRE4_9GAMM|nr:D-alanyl-D-alanine carboxypeptidase family protein [Methylogaea oryzae]BBL71867.1 D-Ala-D-Ala carboxypeptidase [Methylogaea oryzae]
MQIMIPAAPELPAKAYYVEDFHSGRVLVESNADERLPPASLTKIMTAYVVFRELGNGNLKLTDLVTISQKAWHTEGSRMFIEVGKKVPVEDLIKGMIIQSGNDASVALAEHIAGDETIFAQMMNQQAERLGMKNSHFINSHGDVTPEVQAQHYTTARDMSIVTHAIIREYPQYYKWHSQKEFFFNGIKQMNRNKLLWRDETVDGVKTGHTEAAGFCLVASALRDGMRLISVVLGTKSDEARASSNQALLNYGFRFFETRPLYKAGEKLAEAKVWKGAESAAPMGLREDLYVTIPRKQYEKLKATMDMDKEIAAPIAKGQVLGRVNIYLNDEVITQAPLVALADVAAGGIFRRMMDNIRMIMH